jgi:hypothetical protein
VQIQRNFLWGGCVEDKKYCWIKWDQICLPKDKGGLGVKNLELFNLVLLSTWKWRFLIDGDAMWADLLRCRYGHLPSLLLGGDHSIIGAKAPVWWKDVTGVGGGFVEDWFRPNVGCCVGDGNSIGFWKFKWFGNQSFKDLFSSLFAKELFADASVAERILGNKANSRWAWYWKDQLSDVEEQHLNNLIESLAGFTIQLNVIHRWRWIPGSADTFSVRSYYNLLLDIRQVEVALDYDLLEAVKMLSLLKSLFLGGAYYSTDFPRAKLLTIEASWSTPTTWLVFFAFAVMRIVPTYFFHCSFSKRVWDAVFTWVGKRLPLPGGALG